MLIVTEFAVAFFKVLCLLDSIVESWMKISAMDFLHSRYLIGVFDSILKN